MIDSVTATKVTLDEIYDMSDDINDGSPPYVLLSVIGANNDSNAIGTAGYPPSPLPSPSLSKAPTKYSSIRIDEDLWDKRLQDEGCKKDELVKATYRQNKIPPFGPPPNARYYPDLSAIAIDFSKAMTIEKSEGRGWSRVPKNNTDIKTRIIERLLMLRKMNSDHKYLLCQTNLIGVLETTWGIDYSAQTIEDNDNVTITLMK